MKKIISLVLTLAILVTMFSLSFVNASAETSNPYSDAAMQLDKDYAYDGELGAIYSSDKTVFKLWSPNAEKVVLNLYTTGSDKEEGAKKIKSVDMVKLLDNEKFTGVWQIEEKGDLNGVFYTYSITQNNSILGTGADVTIETQDIYSKAVGVNGNRSMVVDLSDTDPDNWDKDNHVFVENQTDASIWEVQVKDFSYNENSGVSKEHRGKFLAFTENGTTLEGKGSIPTCVDYLKTLGITHVQINPFYDFATIDESSGDDTQFNWGYDPKNYGTPEGSYSTNPYDGYTRIKECKEMIQALHNAGIGVIMDVVYNHTYSIDSSFTASVPEYYYRLNADGSYSAQSGCGNDTATERAMYRKYFREMLKYWVEEYHIDGYRFDLMGVHDVETMNMVRKDMDEISPKFIMYGEGWGGNTTFDPVSCTGEPVYGCTQTNAARVDSRIGLFNDVIRDGLKGGVFDGPTSMGFVNGNMLSSVKVNSGIVANSIKKSQNWVANAPTQTVTYASCHDNYTLYDKLTSAYKLSTAVDYRARYDTVIKQNKLTAAIVSMSQGINFMLAGEEMGRSKDGDDNSYKSPATENMIDWSQLASNADLVSYYKGLLELRKAYSPVRATKNYDQTDEYTWHWITGKAATTPYIAYTINNTKEGEWGKVAFMYNGSKVDKEVSLKTDTEIDENTEWVIVANEKGAGVTKIDENKGTVFTVPAFTPVIAVEKTSFDKAAIKSKFSTVKVENIIPDSKQPYSEFLVKGVKGEGYETRYDGSVPLKYEYDKSEGPVSGKFTDEELEAKYLFKMFTPDSLTAEKGDVDDDKRLAIMDGTALQSYFAKLITLDEEHLKRGDYNYDGKTTILDVTFLQGFLAKLDVTVWNVTTNHIGLKDGKETKVADSPVIEYRLGDKYETIPAYSSYYVLTETPDNATGTVTGDIVVNYRYEYQVKEIKLHVRHSKPEEVTWKPFLWAWVHDGETGQDVNIYSAWPGLMLTDKEGDWYNVSFSCPANSPYCIIISNNGSPQTADYTGINYNEAWVVIDDDNLASPDMKWIDIYDYNPDIAD